MTQFLPPNLLALFAPRDPILFKSPTGQLTWEKDRERTPYTGVGNLVHLFEDPKDTPAPTRGETKEEKKKRRIKEKAVICTKELDREVKNWDPHGSKSATGDAFKTLFVARINYDTSESKLRREFETYGPIRKIRMVQDTKNGKPRGYAFIEYEHERDMHSAYKSADGKKIDKRRVIVDVERGRTVKGWRPRRLGGGMGGTRRAANEDLKSREPTREQSREKTRDRDRTAARRKSKSREKDRRKRSRSRDRDRRNDRDRDRSKRDKERTDRDRDRDRKRDKDKGERSTDTNEEGRNKDRGDRKHRHRDRSRERDNSKKDRERKRSRERDRGKSDRDKDKSEDGKPSAKTEENNGYSSNANNKMETDEALTSYANNSDHYEDNNQVKINQEPEKDESRESRTDSYNNQTDY